MDRLKNKRVLLIITALVVITSILVPTTLSKYITTVTNTGDNDKINGTRFNFNENGTQNWTYAFLGATADDGTGIISPDSADAFETIDEGKALAPGQSGYFSLDIDFIADVDAIASADASSLVGAGAYADFATSLDLVGLRFIVATEEITPDFTSDAAVITSDFLPLLVETMEKAIGGEDNYYDCGQDASNVIDETVYVYWEWLEDFDNAADTALGLAVEHNAVPSTLTLNLSMTVEQVELDGIPFTAVTSAEEFNAALAANKTSIRLGADVDLGGAFDSTSLVNLDLGGYTLTCDSFKLTNDAQNALITVKNGNIVTSAEIAANPGYSIYVSVPNGTVNYTDVINTVADGMAAFANGSISTINLFGNTKFVYAGGSIATVVIPSNTRVVVATTEDIALEVEDSASNVTVVDSRPEGATNNLGIDIPETAADVDISTNPIATIAPPVVTGDGAEDTTYDGLVGLPIPDDTIKNIDTGALYDTTTTNGIYKAVVEAQAGETIALGKGTFLFSPNQEITPKANVTITGRRLSSGEPQSKIVRNVIPTNNTMLMYINAANITFDSIWLEYATQDNKWSQRNRLILLGAGGINFTLKNSYLKASGDCNMLINPDSAANISILNCTLDGGSTGVYYRPSANVGQCGTISGNTFINQKTCCISFEPNGVNTFAANITGNTFEIGSEIKKTAGAAARTGDFKEYTECIGIVLHYGGTGDVPQPVESNLNISGNTFSAAENHVGETLCVYGVLPYVVAPVFADSTQGLFSSIGTENTIVGKPGVYAYKAAAADNDPATYFGAIS